MFSSHEAMIAKFMDKNDNLKNKDIFEIMNDLNIIIADFQKTIHTAQSPNSPGGIKIVAEEKLKVKEAIVKLEQILLYLQIAMGEN